MDIGYENPDVLESKDIESLDLINERNLQALIDRQLPSLKGVGFRFLYITYRARSVINQLSQKMRLLKLCKI